LNNKKNYWEGSSRKHGTHRDRSQEIKLGKNRGFARRAQELSKEPGKVCESIESPGIGCRRRGRERWGHRISEKGD